jgi:bilirubin oxidase
MVTRRRLLAAGSAAGAAVLLGTDVSWAAPPRLAAAATLDPLDIPKYVTALTIPPAMPTAGTDEHSSCDVYDIAVRQFRQHVLPDTLPETTVWGYGSVAHPKSFSYPAFTINARVGRPVRVTWANQLVDERGRFLPPLLPVDPTLHWANPPGGNSGRDSMPTFTSTPPPYTGPVPVVVHLHGANTSQESDGYPEAWYLPDARDIPAQFARVGSYYDKYRAEFEDRYKIGWRPGTATFQYGNDQRATTLWFHDHALGVSRENVYAGLAGFYLLGGGPADLAPGILPGPAPAIGDKPGRRYYDIPVVIQDRTFNTDGSLFYPAQREDYAGPYIPTTDVPPIWNPEYFGNAMLANGRTWPTLRVEQRRYRFRFLNGSNSRVLFLKIAADPTARPVSAALPIWQIGSDGGFLPAPVRLDEVFLTMANRVDAIVDFSDVPVGTALYLINEGPDKPYHGGLPYTNFPPANPDTTGQVMKFVVVPRMGADRSVPPDRLRLPKLAPPGPATNIRRLSLSEQASTSVPTVDPVITQLGIVTAGGTAVPLRWGDPVTELPAVGSTEIWEFQNSTVGAHPIHLHKVQFQVLGRGPNGDQPPTAQESGLLDTVNVNPSEITRIKMTFDEPGRFVWHCHTLEHEDNEMMRPFEIVPKGAPPTGDGASTGTNTALAAAGAAALTAAAAGAVVLARGAKTPAESADEAVCG